MCCNKCCCIPALENWACRGPGTSHHTLGGASRVPYILANLGLYGRVTQPPPLCGGACLHRFVRGTKTPFDCCVPMFVCMLLTVRTMSSAGQAPRARIFNKDLALELPPTPNVGLAGKSRCGLELVIQSGLCSSMTRRVIQS